LGGTLQLWTQTQSKTQKQNRNKQHLRETLQTIDKHTRNLAVHLLVREQNQLLVADNRAT
jgi:hypothetical protein